MAALIPANWRKHVTSSDDSPSRRHNVTVARELTELQGVANFIQEMARKLSLPLICVNTAIVYTQRFYLHHSLATFEKHCLGASALFLAAKVEDHPRKVEHVYQVAKLLGRANKEVSESDYIDDVLFNENIILQTLGFEIYIEHPHSHVVRLCEMFSMSKKFSQTAYIHATYCLQLTRICLFHEPAIVACLCIRMTCRMMHETPRTADGKKSWFQLAVPKLTEAVLEDLCAQFQAILNTCPSQWKTKTLSNNHQSLASKMVLTPTGLPMFGEAPPTTPDLNTSKPSKRSERAEQTPRRTPESSKNTPQTHHRFSEIPTLTKIETTTKKFMLCPDGVEQKTAKQPVGAHLKSHQPLVTNCKLKESAQGSDKNLPGQSRNFNEKKHSQQSLLKKCLFESKKQSQRPLEVKAQSTGEKHLSSKPTTSMERKDSKGHPKPKPNSYSETKKHQHGHSSQKPKVNDEDKQEAVSLKKRESTSEKKTPKKYNQPLKHHHQSSHLPVGSNHSVGNKPRTKTLPPSHSMPDLSDSSEKTQTSQNTAPAIPKVSCSPTISKTLDASNHSHYPSLSKHQVASSMTDYALPELKTEEFQTLCEEITDWNQSYTSQSDNPFGEDWPPSTVDFSILTDCDSDISPWNIPPPDFRPPTASISRELSLTSTSSEMNMLKISNNQRELSGSVGSHDVNRLAKRFKPN